MPSIRLFCPVRRVTVGEVYTEREAYPLLCYAGMPLRVKKANEWAMGISLRQLGKPLVCGSSENGLPIIGEEAVAICVFG